MYVSKNTVLFGNENTKDNFKVNNEIIKEFERYHHAINYSLIQDFLHQYKFMNFLINNMEQAEVNIITVFEVV